MVFCFLSRSNHLKLGKQIQRITRRRPICSHAHTNALVSHIQNRADTLSSFCIGAYTVSHLCSRFCKQSNVMIGCVDTVGSYGSGAKDAQIRQEFNRCLLILLPEKLHFIIHFTYMESIGSLIAACQIIGCLQHFRRISIGSMGSSHRVNPVVAGPFFQKLLTEGKASVGLFAVTGFHINNGLSHPRADSHFFTCLGNLIFKIIHVQYRSHTRQQKLADCIPGA